MKHDVKLEVNEHPAFVVPYIDGECLPFCTSIEPYRNTETGEETVKFEMTENPLGILMSYCECDLSAYTKIATIILRDELLKHGDLYEGFAYSIESSLSEQMIFGMPFQPQREIAYKILDRIIGDD